MDTDIKIVVTVAADSKHKALIMYMSPEYKPDGSISGSSEYLRAEVVPGDQRTFAVDASTFYSVEQIPVDTNIEDC